MGIAGQYFKAHRHVFGPDDELVRKAKRGDRVIIWARAQYPVRPLPLAFRFQRTMTDRSRGGVILSGKRAHRQSQAGV